MKRLCAFLLLTGLAWAQERGELVTAADGLSTVMCEKIRDTVMPRIEAFTRMKFRRSVPMRVQPKAVWEAAQKEGGFAGAMAKHGLAFYNPGANDVTVVPWVIGGYPPPGQPGTPQKRAVDEWVMALEPILIHELTHAIHHQNFYNEGRFDEASLRSDGLSETELDTSTVDFLLGEGFPELVSARTTEFKEHLIRYPHSQIDGVRTFLRRYVPNKKDPYRVTLAETGYVDGLDLLHCLQLRTGARGVRAVLYRLPPRILLFQPDLLAAVELEDPPDPDSIFGFLSPEVLKGRDVRLACNPGSGRMFESAYEGGARADGCLLGYVAEIGAAGDAQGECRYAFFVSDPDAPGDWSSAQASSLKMMNAAGAAEKEIGLPMAETVKAKVITVKMEDGSHYVRGETSGLVVLAHEAKPTPALEERVVLALRALYERRPKANLYGEAKAKAQQLLDKGSD